MGYVIVHNETGKYVARPGEEHSYTMALENAQRFRTREEAKANCCIENEHVVSVANLLRPF